MNLNERISQPVDIFYKSHKCLGVFVIVIVFVNFNFKRESVRGNLNERISQSDDI